MSPRKTVNKGDLLGLMQEYTNGATPPIEPLRASEIVTYPALAGVLSTLEERHNGLVALMNQGFKNLEDSGKARAEQISRVESALEKRITEEVTRNDTRFGWIVGSVVVAFLAEIARFIFK